MRLFQSRRLRATIIAYGVAVAIGVTAAFAAPRGAPDGVAAAAPVSAATHCTNYFPHYYTPDTNCLTLGFITGGTWGQTPSTALRDTNCIIVQANRSLEVWYGEYTPASTYGTNLCQGASIGYQVAGCKLDSASGVNGRCRTDWHN
jgi:hypothetical protein